MKKSNKVIVFVLVGIITLSLVVGFFLPSASILGKADQAISSTNYTKIFYATLKKVGGIGRDNANRKGLIKQFCKTIFDSDIVEGFPKNDTCTQETQIDCNFTPTQSLFATLVCQRVDNKIPTAIQSSYLNYASYDKLFQACSRSNNMNSCSISVYFSKILNGIINDYMNSKIAGIYGYTEYLSKNKEENIIALQSGASAFSDYYFGKCGTGAGKELYINKDQLNGSNLEYCSHPNTYKVLTNFIEQSQQKVANNVFIDYNTLLSKGGPKVLMRDALATNCSLASPSPAKLNCGLESFSHLVMNELLFYSLFMEFYSAYVPTSEQFGPLTIGMDKSKTKEVLDEEVRKAQLEMQVTQHAVSQDMNILRNLFAKLPIHIGMVAYLEDLVNFRNELIKLYTPIHQMSEKLKNAQTRDA